MKKLNLFPLLFFLIIGMISFNGCKSTSSKDEMFCSTLVVTADTNCIVFVDGDQQGEFKAGDAKKVYICKGEHLVVAKSADKSKILAKKIIIIGDSISKVVDLQISHGISILDTTVQSAKDTSKSQQKVEVQNKQTENEAEKVENEPEKQEEVPVVSTSSYTDPRDGKVYKIIRIGSQTWMAENLAYKTSAGCWAYNDKESNVATYGYLYDWLAAKSAVPAGWRLPSDADWQKLIDHLGGFKFAGGKLKALDYWSSPNTGATNSSGFSALAGGYHYASKDGFFLMGTYGLWWTSTSIGETSAYYFHLLSDNTYAFRSSGKKEDGLSVRCVK